MYNDETIEKHSTEFERTFMLCDEFNVKYEYEDTGLGFRFIFYRKNVHGHVQVKISKRDIELLDLLTISPSLTIKDLSIKLDVSEKTIYRSLNKLKEINKIVRVGTDKTGYWKVIK